MKTTAKRLLNRCTIAVVTLLLSGYAQSQRLYNGRAPLNSPYPARGSVFFSENFLPGEFRVVGGPFYQAAILYNMYNNEIIVKMGKKRRKLGSSQGTEFKIGNHHFVSVKRHFYELLYDGKVKLLRNYYCTLLVRGVDEAPGRYFTREEYYLYLSNGKLKLIDPSKKTSVLNALRPEQVEVTINEDMLHLHKIDYLKEVLEQYFPS
ncbi:MAG: hypothetical protein U0Y10_14460 [Spirosomataceae bacterium]